MGDLTAVLKQYSVELSELRKKLIKVGFAFAAGFLVGFIFNQQILLFCIHSFNFHGVNIVVTSPTQLIELSFYTALMMGFIFASPIFIYEILMYVKPALSTDEYKLLKSYSPISFVLFVVGGVFGLWITQLILVIFSQFSSQFKVNNIWDVQRFFGQVIMTSFLTGIIFQLPLVLTILIRFGFLTRKYLSSQRSTVYAVLLIVAVLLPPTDLVSLIMLTAPLLGLFEITMLLNIKQP